MTSVLLSIILASFILEIPGQMGEDRWGTTPIQAVIEAELLPYAHAIDHQIELQGPHIELAPNDARSKRGDPRQRS